MIGVLKLIVGIVSLVIIVYLIYFRYKISKYACIPNVTTPVKINMKGNVECMSTDGSNCYWGQCPSTTVPKGIKPLVCGDMHKKVYGITGYDTPGHWCSEGLRYYKSLH